MKRLIVDRIEEGFAVCELDGGAFEVIALSALPDGVREGNVLLADSDGSVRFDRDTERERKEKLLKLQDSLFDES